MRLKIIYLAMILVATVVLASCNAADTKVNTNNSNITATAPPQIPNDGARRITTDELEKLMKEGKAYVIDVRLQDAYDLGHIPGARLIPAGEIQKHVKELPRDKMIVTYCA